MNGGMNGTIQMIESLDSKASPRKLPRRHTNIILHRRMRASCCLRPIFDEVTLFPTDILLCVQLGEGGLDQVDLNGRILNEFICTY